MNPAKVQAEWLQTVSYVRPTLLLFSTYCITYTPTSNHLLFTLLLWTYLIFCPYPSHLFLCSCPLHNYMCPEGLSWHIIFFPLPAGVAMYLLKQPDTSSQLSYSCLLMPGMSHLPHYYIHLNRGILSSKLYGNLTSAGRREKHQVCFVKGLASGRISSHKTHVKIVIRVLCSFLTCQIMPYHLTHSSKKCWCEIMMVVSKTDKNLIKIRIIKEKRGLFQFVLGIIQNKLDSLIPSSTNLIIYDLLYIMMVMLKQIFLKITPNVLVVYFNLAW